MLTRFISFNLWNSTYLSWVRAMDMHIFSICYSYIEIPLQSFQNNSYFTYLNRRLKCEHRYMYRQKWIRVVTLLTWYAQRDSHMNTWVFALRTWEEISNWTADRKYFKAGCYLLLRSAPDLKLYRYTDYRRTVLSL